MTSENANFTVAIVDSIAARRKKLNRHLNDAGFSVTYSLIDRKLTSDILKGINVDVLFVHVNDVLSSILNNLVALSIGDLTTPPFFKYQASNPL